MGRKKTNEEWLAEANAISDEYEWLEEYVNAKTKIRYRHKACGYIGTTTPDRFLAGHMCLKCSNEIQSITQKNTNEQWLAKANAISNEYEWLSEYKGSRIPIVYKHKKCGNIGTIIPDTFLRGAVCKYCGNKKRGIEARYTNEEWLKKANAASDEYEWLDKYEKSDVKIRALHKVCGTISYYSPSAFLQGARCKSCAIKKNSEKQKKTNEQWLKEAMNKDDSYSFLEPYNGANRPIKFVHIPCGTVGKVSPSSFLSSKGYHCKICFNGISGEGNIKTQKQWLKDISSRSDIDNYIFLEEYKGSHTKIRYLHTVCGKEHSIEPSSFLSGRGCPCLSIEKTKETNVKRYGVEHKTQINIDKEKTKTFTNKDLFEKLLTSYSKKPTIVELAEYFGRDYTGVCKKVNEYNLQYLIDVRVTQAEREIKDIFPQLGETNRTILNGLELDCYSETHKLAVEYNGIYWHSTNKTTNKTAKPQNYHDNKTRMCQDLGIRLIHIWEYEWNTRQEQCIKLISNALGLNREKIYARNCTIGYPASKEYADFMEKEHIQGSSNASIKIGLYYNNKLVMCCGIRNESNQYNLVRMSSSINVIGGASRLAKHFPTDKPMVTFCDTGKFTGTVYPKMGFTKVGEVPPRYVWVNNKFEVKSRRACQKQYICETDNDWNKTEVEIMTQKGYYQCYGSHMDKYIREANYYDE